MLLVVTKVWRMLSRAALEASALGSFVLVMGIAGVWVFASEAAGIWKGQRVRIPPSGSDYCEHIRLNDALRTPANAWSNLTYWAAGSILFALALYDWQISKLSKVSILLPTPPAFTIFNGVFISWLGVASFLFHAALTDWAQDLDLLGMGTVLTPPFLLVIYQYHRQRLLKQEDFIQEQLSAKLERLQQLHNRLVAAGWFLCIVVTCVAPFIRVWAVAMLFLVGSLCGILVIEFCFRARRAIKTRRQTWLFGSALLSMLVNLCQHISSYYTSIISLHAIAHHIISLHIYIIF